jgi:cell division protein FtsQ
MARSQDPEATQGFDAQTAAHEEGPEPAPAPDPALERNRRRFARRQRARRWLAWRRLLVVLVVLLVVVGGLWLVLGSPYLSVKGAHVTGVEQLRAAEVARAAEVPVGEPLATVDLDRIRTRVEALAAVQSADVTREWPDRVRIAVTERQPVAVVSLGGRLRGLDDDGIIFRDYQKAPADLPRIETAADTGAEALREGARVVAALPGDLAARVDHVDVATVDEITLELRDGRKVTWGSADQTEQKAAVLAELLDAVRADQYDVSVPGQPTTR